jgi:hypothetical protein
MTVIRIDIVILTILLPMRIAVRKFSGVSSNSVRMLAFFLPSFICPLNKILFVDTIEVSASPKNIEAHIRGERLRRYLE